MKKLFLFGMIGAIALTFNACSSDDELANGTVEQKEVKTRFALSLTDNVGTRMEAGAAQENGKPDFQGMKGIQLFPSTAAAINASTPLELSPIHLADFTAFDAENVNAKIYTDVSIPVGVKSFLFYGMKYNNQGGALDASYDKQDVTGGADAGQTSASTPESITFSMVSIFNGSLNQNTDAKEVLKALNEIEAVLGDGTATPTEYQKFWRAMTAGSTTTIAAAAEDLYNAIKFVDPTEATMSAKIEEYFSITGDPGKYVATWKFADFPQSINLPDGAVKIGWNGTEFKYVQGNTEGLNDSNNNEVKAQQYVKPAELYYTINTTARTSNASQADNIRNFFTDWETDVQNATYYNGNEVTASTRSVALAKQVQYAVGDLALSVIIDNKNLLDSGDGVTGSSTEAPQNVTVPAAGYPVTGVLIGGQKNVKWDFTPQNTTTEYSIYDGVMTNSAMKAIRGAESVVNHTLALETLKDAVINVCVEFENTGEDFYGVNHQVIPHGTKFYLVAQLDPKNATNYDATTLNKVFFQDHTTKLKLTIAETSLQGAYNTIPDLRSPKLEFALSVNLEWQQGLIFEQNF